MVDSVFRFDSFTEVPDEDRVHQPRSFPLGRPPLATVFNRPSASRILAEALAPDGRVDFPTVTEICEGLVGNKSEMAAVVELLSFALQKDASLPQMRQSSLQLKALTVAHEMLYDSDAREALMKASSFTLALRGLRHQQFREAEPHGCRSFDGPADESARLLTSELCRALNTTLCQL